MHENKDLKRNQGCAKQEITDEVKDFVDNEVKIWKEEKGKDIINFKKIFEQEEMEHKENMKKEVIKVSNTKENIIRNAAEKKRM